MRRATAVTVVVGALALGACSSGADDVGPTSTSRSASRTPPSTVPTSSGAATSSSVPLPTAQAAVGEARVLTDRLSVPWGVAFLPGGDALVGERDTHRIERVSTQGAAVTVGTIPGVRDNAGEGGLLGLALSPDFATDARVFAYISSENDNRVVRFTYRDGDISGVTPVFTGIPTASIHNGGRIAFGPDGYLYVTTGDAGQSDRAPDKDYLGGKVLRMTAAGEPAAGNPDANSVVWTRGHRNPQGLAFAPNGAIYEAEFGQNTEDEINLLEGGRDYGWPSVEGDSDDDAKGKTPPLTTFATSDASPSGLVYAGGSLWLATLQGERLYRMSLTDDGIGEPKRFLDGDYGRLRTIAVAPGGSLWVTTSNQDGRGDPSDTDDRIIRVPLTS